jgi:hypothetical protein
MLSNIRRRMAFFNTGGEMGVRNYLIEGVSGTGKTTVCDALQRRGYHAVHGDRALAYQGDPDTGEPLDDAVRARHAGDAAFVHGHHIWDVDRVKALVADRGEPISFFCGGARNLHRFSDLFDAIFVLEIDIGTLNRRLAERPPDEWGARASERELVARLHATGEDVPRNAIRIDATAPIARVVDAILVHCGEDPQGAGL